MSLLRGLAGSYYGMINKTFNYTMSARLDIMANFICLELGVFDDTSLALCKAFLNKEYNTLWDKYPWGDAMGTGTAQILADVSVVDYPAGMDRITTVRASTGV